MERSIDDDAVARCRCGPGGGTCGYDVGGNEDARGAETFEQRAELRAGCATIRARLGYEPTGRRRDERLHYARQVLVAHRSEHDP